MREHFEGHPPEALLDQQAANVEAETDALEGKREQRKDPLATARRFAEEERSMHASFRERLARGGSGVRRTLRRLSLLYGLLTVQSFSSEMVQTAHASPNSNQKIEHSGQVEQKEAEGVAQRIQQLHQELNDLKDLGYSIKFTDGIAAGQVDDITVRRALPVGEGQSETRLTNQLLHSSGSDIYLASDPLEQLHFKYAILKEIQPALSETHSLEINRYSIEASSPTTGDEVQPQTIQVIDWADAKNPIIFSSPLDAGTMSPEKFDELLHAIKERSAEPMEQSGRASPAETNSPPRRFTYELAQDIARPALAEQLRRAFSVTDNIFIESVPEGGEIDRTLNLGSSRDFSFSKPVEMTLNDSITEVNNNVPIRINGQVTTIRLKQDISFQTYDKTRGTIDGKPIVNQFTDQYGNFVQEICMPYKGVNKGNHVLLISPPIEFGSEHDPRERTVNIDLTPMGAGPVEGFFVVPIKHPISHTGPEGVYRIYTNMDSSEVVNVFANDVPAIGEGMQRLEQVFGFEPGSMVRNAYIVNAKRSNAFANKKDRGTIFFQDELLRGDEGVRETAIHESVHALDMQLNLSGGAFEELFVQLQGKAEFFSQLNESKFASGGYGGHSADNYFEFLASFMNSLLNPKWEKSMTDKSDEFRSLYLETIRALQKQVSEIKEIKEDAPIKSLLRERERVLEHQPESTAR